MTDIITIDGNTYDVPIVSLKSSTENLDKYAERTAAGVLYRELIGSYDKYSVVFGKSHANPTAYASLYSKIIEATEFHTVKLPTPDGIVTMEAYFAGIEHALYYIKGSTKLYEGLKMNIIPREPQRTPA